MGFGVWGLGIGDWVDVLRFWFQELLFGVLAWAQMLRFEFEFDVAFAGGSITRPGSLSALFMGSFADFKNGIHHTPRCTPAAGPNAPRRCPLYCAGGGGGGGGGAGTSVAEDRPRSA